MIYKIYLYIITIRIWQYKNNKKTVRLTNKPGVVPEKLAKRSTIHPINNK